MPVTRTAALAALAAVAACSLPPEPGAPAPTGITATRGGGTQVVDPAASRAGTLSNTRVTPAR